MVGAERGGGGDADPLLSGLTLGGGDVDVLHSNAGQLPLTYLHCHLELALQLGPYGAYGEALARGTTTREKNMPFLA